MVQELGGGFGLLRLADWDGLVKIQKTAFGSWFDTLRYPGRLYAEGG